MPRLYIIAGPNGAGKSTFAQEFLPQFARCRHFVNADLIASGLSPFDPAGARLKAGRLLLARIHELINGRHDFGFESTLAGKSYVPLIAQAKKAGYSTHIFFLWIPDVRLAKARIRQRVKNGGHDVPEEDIKRRFIRSRRNFMELYQGLCDTWIIYDNSSGIPKEIARKNMKDTIIINRGLYAAFRSEHDKQTKK